MTDAEIKQIAVHLLDWTVEKQSEDTVVFKKIRESFVINVVFIENEMYAGIKRAIGQAKNVDIHERMYEVIMVRPPGLDAWLSFNMVFNQLMRFAEDTIRELREIRPEFM